MTEFTPARLAELRAVAEAATEPDHYVCDCYVQCGDEVCPNPKPIFKTHDNDTVLALIDAVEAANESKPSNSVTSGSANERELADLRAALEAKTAEVERLVREALDAMPEQRLGVLVSHLLEAERERDEARAEASKIEGRAVEWSKRAETAEAAAKYATGRMIDARALLQQMADRIDPFVFDELASELDDQPLDANGDTFEHRLNRAEAALERVRALHPRKEFDDSPGEFYCDACQRTAGLWPCPTVQAIEGAADE